MMRGLADGFSIFNIYLVPSRLLLATLVFVFLMLVNRLIQVNISRRSPYYVKEGVQVATASIVGYACFAVFLIVSLVIAGVNFTGLAIIAGALSVGIGFGLQSIANNFISGLILLLDSPIRAGDRIQVGDIEGTVKRIRLRATQVYTSRHADVFIPNSEMLSKSVTNFVFHDKTWSVVCPVMVGYGCNVNEVRKILLTVAEKHPDVIKDPKKQPHVLLKAFADSGLLFELWCLISDVSKRGEIESDMNFAIYEAFQQNKVNIPYPQQDVHIKDWPSKPKLD
jgi:small-conductance mechanosensitive channel